MPRALGDTNLSLREKRMKAENELLKIENAALKDKNKAVVKIAKLRKQELNARLAG
jgi:hypothetical protein